MLDKKCNFEVCIIKIDAEFIDFSESIRFFLRFWKFENFER